MAGPFPGEADHCSPSKMLKVAGPLSAIASRAEMQHGQIQTVVMILLPLPHRALAAHASQNLLLVVSSPALVPRLLWGREQPSSLLVTTLGALDLRMCGSPGLRMETDVLLAQASLEGDVAVELQEETTWPESAFPNTAETTMSARSPGPLCAKRTCARLRVQRQLLQRGVSRGSPEHSRS